jgi:hypothetical protein
MHQRYIEEIDRMVENQARRARRVPAGRSHRRLDGGDGRGPRTDRGAAHAFGPSHDRGGPNILAVPAACSNYDVNSLP